MSSRAALLGLAVGVLLVPVGAASAGAAASGPSAASASGWSLAPGKPALVPLLRHDVATPPAAQLQSGGHRVEALTTADVSVVPAPPSGPTQSTWQVTYTGFDSGSNANGPAAQAAFQAAVDIWSQIVTSSVPIKVDATFAALGTGVLGEAGPSGFYSAGGTLEASALADSIAGTDLSTQYSGAPPEDIDAMFSSSPSAGFYYGTDGDPPPGEVDFESVVLHELGHGLGFLGAMDINSAGQGVLDSPDPTGYDGQTYDGPSGNGSLLSEYWNTGDIAKQLQSQSVYWGGSEAVTTNGGVRPRLFAPSPWEPGSSYSHLDESTYPMGNANSLMTPAISDDEVIHSPGPIAVAMLVDLGWKATFPGLAAPPSPPTDVTAVRGASDAVVSWTAATENGAPITDYQVSESPNGVVCASQTTSCTTAPLTDGRTYTFTVVALSAVGNSAPSDPSNAIVAGDVPGRPGNVTATRGDGSIQLSWDAASANGFPISQYVATASPGGQTCTTTTETQCAITGLTNGTSYSVSVAATNDLGTGPPGSPEEPVVPAAPPSPPLSVTAVPGNTTVQVSWDPSTADNGEPIYRYTAFSSADGRFCSTTTATECIIPDLTNGTAYTFTVVATNGVGDSVASDPSVSVTPVGPPATVPDPPSTPTVTFGRTSTPSAAVTWSAPSFDGGSPIMGYDLQESGDAGSTWTSVSTAFYTDGSTSQTVTGLTIGKTYKFRVAAINFKGIGTYSAASAPWVMTDPNAPHVVRLAVGSTWPIRFGQWTTLRTTVTDLTAKGLLAHSPVVLQAKPAGARSFNQVATATSGSNGVAAVIVRPKVDTTYRWVRRASTGLAAATSATERVQVAQTVAVAKSSRTIRHRTVVRLFGTVSPADPHAVVTLERKVNGRWRATTGHAKLIVQKLPNGRRVLGYVIVVPSSDKGRHTYRIYRPATSKNVAGASASIVVTIG